MAPTELLAEQHAINFAQWLNPLGIEVGWLAGKLKGKARESELARIASGEAKWWSAPTPCFRIRWCFRIWPW
ncbi:ATP-dependent DNA helicase RecG [Photobacterium aphoticum]|uniref:ATP-dependent DNA helicase RecG n=1 Tax=Photobacterium aphoticum TaxID=754436 RepID=A0A090RDT1_9GAMM|nr:ATP-dependent DNA helicase RecG [Photobacterium aphoticum]